LCGIAAAGVIFGSMVLRADNQFAEMGRQAAARLIGPRVATGHRVMVCQPMGLLLVRTEGRRPSIENP
jgi:hypothetical protein